MNIYKICYKVVSFKMNIAKELLHKIFSYEEEILYGRDFEPDINCPVSVKSYDETHILLEIFGIKIKFPKREYSKLKKQNPFYKYKARGVDITKLPPAQGRIRDIQLANLVLLKELDYVCRQSKLSYWLDGGTLLGAVRHKGFIPWDDDIDVGMLFDDYEKIIGAFENFSRDKNIYAQYFKDKRNPDIYMIKVLHKKCPHLFVDIFPFYRYGKTLTTTEQVHITKEIKKIRKNVLSNIDFCTNDSELKQLHQKTMNEKILCINDEIPQNSDLVWGIQYNHCWNNWFTRYDVIFPIKPIVFEGYEFMGMNNPQAFLSRVYGDYMSYPSKITFGHSAYKNLKKEELETIKNYASNNRHK